MSDKKTDIIIIGAGAAGMTAAIYALRAGKSVLVFENGQIGGRITESYKIENYPGIVSVSGESFADSLLRQVESLGGIIIRKKVLNVRAHEKCVITDEEMYYSKALILAPGLKNRIPQAENTQKFIGRGLSFCALCDGPLFKGRTVCVIGGGNTALSEAIYLSEICQKVYLIHRKNIFRAESLIIQKAAHKKNISILMNTDVISFLGDNILSGIEVITDGHKKIIELNGAFSAIGYIPGCELYQGVVKTDSNGFAITDESCATNEEGVFIAGDCRKKDVRQLTTAVSDGSIAAFNACKYIESLK